MGSSSGMAPLAGSGGETAIRPRARPSAAPRNGVDGESPSFSLERLSNRPAYVRPFSGRRTRRADERDVRVEERLEIGSEKSASGPDLHAEARRVSSVGRIPNIRRRRVGIRHGFGEIRRSGTGAARNVQMERSGEEAKVGAEGFRDGQQKEQSLSETGESKENTWFERNQEK
mmetsp:Transcript_6703/g.14432  ORF Transcript_6703/g.14432 Transcript_6703/m.14432 type:complete len:173 (-) Transcript_6703:357-875(-)